MKIIQLITTDCMINIDIYKFYLFIHETEETYCINKLNEQYYKWGFRRVKC
jgi:hypothetical protein